MENAIQFHWWYIPLALVLMLMFFGKSKGGVVVSRVCAKLDVLDARFNGCRAKAKYSTFKAGKPDHIEIELDDLDLPEGDELSFVVNDVLLAKVPVKRNKEAEFDHWSDEGVDFPVLKAGDELEIHYQGAVALRGIFQ